MELSREDHFLLQEHAGLRAEIEGKADELRSVLRYSLVTTGAIWTWFATEDWIPGFTILKWLPLMLCLLFCAQYLVLIRDVSVVAAYLRTIEAWFHVDRIDLGWEHRASPKQWGIFWVSLIHWAVLLLGNLLIPLLVKSPP